MQLAQRKYATALRLLARAIYDPEQSPAALTATSSFNLSMFEVRRILYHFSITHPPLISCR